MKIIEKSLRGREKTKRKPETRVVTSAQGKRVKASRVDVGSMTLGEDLLESFTRNVTRARRENKNLLGDRDRVEDDGKY